MEKYDAGFNSKLKGTSIDDSLIDNYVRFEVLSGNSVLIGLVTEIKEEHYVMRPYVKPIFSKDGFIGLYDEIRYIPCNMVGVKDILPLSEVQAFCDNQNKEIKQSKKSTNSKSSQ